MLEHELARLQQENFASKARADHLENIVYGSGPKRMDSIRKSLPSTPAAAAANNNIMIANYSRDGAPVDVRQGLGASSSSVHNTQRVSPAIRLSKGTRLNYAQQPSPASAKAQRLDRGRSAHKCTQNLHSAVLAPGQVPSARNCSRSPTRCWAAATVSERENCELNQTAVSGRGWGNANDAPNSQYHRLAGPGDTMNTATGASFVSF